MLDEATRTAILKLKSEGSGERAIAKAVGVSRSSVRRVLKAGAATVPAMARGSQVEPFREQILELYARYGGHLVRVHEALEKAGAPFSYTALTAFCRKHEIGRAQPKPAGRYTFEAGEEMQHDTSPHHAKIGGTMRAVNIASLVLCSAWHSRPPRSALHHASTSVRAAFERPRAPLSWRRCACESTPRDGAPAGDRRSSCGPSPPARPRHSAARHCAACGCKPCGS